MKDFFPTLDMKPNPNCDNKWCVKRQADYQVSRHPHRLEAAAATISACSCERARKLVQQTRIGCTCARRSTGRVGGGGSALGLSAIRPSRRLHLRRPLPGGWSRCATVPTR